ncbi:hypothetical protein H5410_039678 [Solanum commersonii]|uniref:Uncharacterized protein n=1 Tax=Solanum commersonii TaxID=4109 RepID=A0A9J5XP90_SOLCO|nr:hypothetical protein H5410_039678 [Solanum commersonii]
MGPRDRYDDWFSQVNFATKPSQNEKALWSKGKRVRCHTPRLPKVPRGRADAVERRSRRVPHGRGTRRPSQGTSRPTSNTGETESNPIGCRGSIVSAASLDFIVIIFESEGRDLFSQWKKGSRFDSAQPNDTSNTNDLRPRMRC